MKICAECGEQNREDARFCERCGQGLDASGPAPATPGLKPLEPGAELDRGRYQVIELLDLNSRENRYRAQVLGADPSTTVQIREQVGRALSESSAAESEPEEHPPSVAPDQEDPAGPLAKTAELRLPRTAESRNGNDQPDTDQDASAEMMSGAASEAATQSTSLPEGEVTATSDAGLHEASALARPQEEHADEAPQPVGTMPDLGDTFGRVLALSMTLEHPAIVRANGGFAENGRVYLTYPDEQYVTLAARSAGLKMDEGEALNVAIQLCQAVAFVHRRGMRVNDICPETVAFAANGRIRLAGLDYVSNDDETPSEPVFNDGYTAPEVYRGKRIDKRADIFSIGALLYTCLTGERLEVESWREEAGSIHFYPPHVVAPALEQVVRRALQFDPAARWPTVEAFKGELLKIYNTVTLRAAALTDVGMVRELNEDSVLALDYRRESLLDPASRLLYVIADGMGGAEAGEVASAIAVAAIRDYVEEQFQGDKAPALDRTLQEGLETANRKVLEYAAAHPEARGLGSTAVACLSAPPEAAIAWVGDSRAYLSQESGLRQISKDHSLVQRLIEIGQITAEEARHHEHKNVITRSLGARQTGAAGAEASTLKLRRGDRVLLCSDGLTVHVTDDEIARIMRAHKEPAAAAQELIVAANAGGGTDNVSVAVIFAV